MASSRSFRSSDPAGVVRAVLARHVQPGQTLCAAVSGGLDSVVLLDVLAALAPSLGLELSAVHVDHGLSRNAGRWAEHVRRLCEARGVPLSIHRVRVDLDGHGVEDAARRARESVFRTLAADWVCTGHHADDQAETLLHNLCRGAGLRGAAAMPQLRALGAGAPRLLRPLLACARRVLLDHARACGLDWVEDESNADARYTRNLLRHEVLPALAARYPAVSDNLAQAAARFAEAESLLATLAARDLAEIASADGLAAGGLAALGDARARNALRFWLAARGVVPTAARLAEALRQVLAAGAGACVAVPMGRGQLVRYRGVVELAPRLAPAPAHSLPWRGEAVLAWGSGHVRFQGTCGAGLDAARLASGAVSLARRGGGERLRLRAGGPSRSLKNLLQEHAVAPWRRAAMPLLWCGGELAWVPGVGVAAEFACRPGAPGWQPLWEPFPESGATP